MLKGKIVHQKHPNSPEAGRVAISMPYPYEAVEVSVWYDEHPDNIHRCSDKREAALYAHGLVEGFRKGILAAKRASEQATPDLGEFSA